LDGVRVIDVCSGIAGSMATMGPFSQNP